jgi:hypothetical protein
MRFLLVLIAFVLAVPASAQYKVHPRDRYERLIAVVPLVGSGSYSDPIRPLFAPVPGQPRPAWAEQILGFSYQLSDNGKSAIVEFVVQDAGDLRPILEDPRLIKAFLKGKDKRQDVEVELRKLKKDVDLTKLGLALP